MDYESSVQTVCVGRNETGQECWLSVPSVRRVCMSASASVDFKGFESFLYEQPCRSIKDDVPKYLDGTRRQYECHKSCVAIVTNR